MSKFNEADHPRGQTGNSGQWREKDHSAPEALLAEPAPQHSFNIFDYSGVGSNTVDRFPRTVTEAKAALRNVRGEPDGGVRCVFLDSKSLPDAPVVRGPADGRPLLVVVNSGFGRLVVVGGTVIIRSDSSWGNVVYAENDSRVTVITGEGRKVSTEARDRSHIAIVPETGARGLQVAVGQSARITIVDIGVEHEIRYSELRNRSAAG